MFQRYIIIILVVSTMVFGYGNLPKRTCDYIKTIPKQALDLYEKFKDVDASLKLFRFISYDIKPDEIPACLSYDEFENAYKTYLKLALIAKEEQIIKEYLSYMPYDISLLGALADIYRDKYQKDTKQYAQYRLKALKYYARYKQNGGVFDKSQSKFVQTKGLKKDKDIWFKKFNITHIPLDSYQVTYIDRKNPSTVIYQQQPVVIPSLHTNSSISMGTKSIDLTSLDIYWVGDIVFDSNQESNLYVDISSYSNKCKIIIDGYEIPDVTHTSVIPYDFTKGKHRIEIRYSSKKSNIDFMFHIGKRVNYRTNTRLIKDMLELDTQIVVISAKESEEFDKSIKISLDKRYKTPIVLFLNSQESVYWKINPQNNKISQIFVESSRGNSYVESMIEDSTHPTIDKVYHLFSGVYLGDLNYNCSCSKYGSRCEGITIFRLYKNIYDMFDKQLSAYKSITQTELKKHKTINIKENQIDKKTLQKLITQYKKAQQIKSKCNQKDEIEF